MKFSMAEFSPIVLRPYQENLIKNAGVVLRQGKKAPILVLPTGGGKTVVFSEICKRAKGQNSKILILVHRRELIKQSAKKLEDINLKYGVIAAGFKSSKHHVQIASVQTLVRRLVTTVFTPDLIIIDEAHHAVAGSWKKIIDQWPNAIRIGCTATPCRLDGKPLGQNNLFDHLILGPSIPKLVEHNYLAPHKVFAAPQKLQLKQLKTRGGDYAKEELEEEIKRADITGDAVEQYKKHANNLPAIAFCISVNHAISVKQKFNDAGIKADIITGEMDTADRDQVINDLSSGSIQVLVSIEVISEGFDLPICSCAILLRPTKSLSLFLQQCGRILRPQKNKTAIILDHVGNTFVHGFVDEEREWSLTAKVKSRKSGDRAPAVQTCKQCFAAFRPQRVCPSCGYEIPIKARVLTEEEGELIELKKAETKLRIQEKAELEKKQLSLLIAKAQTLDDLKKVAQIQGYKEGWAHQVYKARQKRGQINPKPRYKTKEHQTKWETKLKEIKAKKELQKQKQKEKAEERKIDKLIFIQREKWKQYSALPLQQKRSDERFNFTPPKDSDQRFNF